MTAIKTNAKSLWVYRMIPLIFQVDDAHFVPGCNV
jgi:hypothetical protein